MKEKIKELTDEVMEFGSFPILLFLGIVATFGGAGIGIAIAIAAIKFAWNLF